jgi:DNA-directed RNA polymerase subunit RPC12/RpoP
MTHFCGNCGRKRKLTAAEGHTNDGVYNCGTCGHLIDVDDPRNVKRLAILSDHEAGTWEACFVDAVNDGKSEAAADKHAWKMVQEIFPRLRDFNGCLPETEVSESTPAGDRLDFCPYCGELLESMPLVMGRNDAKRCVKGGVVFRQTHLGTFEAVYSEGLMLGRVHNYID